MERVKEHQYAVKRYDEKNGIAARVDSPAQGRLVSRQSEDHGATSMEKESAGGHPYYKETTRHIKSRLWPISLPPQFFIFHSFNFPCTTSPITRTTITLSSHPLVFIEWYFSRYVHFQLMKTYVVEMFWFHLCYD